MAYMFDDDKSKVDADDDIQEQVTALSNGLSGLRFKARGVEGGQERSFTLLNNTRITMICHSVEQGGNMLVNVKCSSNGSVTIRKMYDGGLQEIVTDGARNLVLRNATAVTAYWAIFIYTGDLNNG